MKCKDLTNQRFGRLIAKRRGENDKTGHTRWFCDCDCGTKDVLVYKDALLDERQVSCGCFSREQKSKTFSDLNRKYNTYDLSGEYGVGYTSKGEEFYFDLEDYEKIKDYCWRKDKNGYIITNDSLNDKKILYLHRLVMDVTCNDKVDVDHIKHKLYDNRKSELRAIKHYRNIQNHIKPSNNTSGVMGVSWNKRKEKWESYITICKKRKKLGYFTDFDEAVKARKKAEEKYFGEYSYDNSMKEGVV